MRRLATKGLALAQSVGDAQSGVHPAALTPVTDFWAARRQDSNDSETNCSTRRFLLGITVIIQSWCISSRVMS
jgi:hypothetical protein